MKKTLLSIVLLVSGMSATAQNASEEIKFKPHWNVQVQGGAGATLGEADFFDLISPAAQVTLGYQFNPVLGVRLQGSGWEAKGGWVSPEQTYSFNYISAGVDVRASLSNWLCGYNPHRLLDVGVFAGAAANFGWNNGEARNLKTHGNRDLPYAWGGTKVRPQGRVGVDANFRLSDCVSVGLEVNGGFLSDKFNSKKADNLDWQFNALLGVKVALGKTHEHISKPVAPTVQKSTETAAQERPRRTRPQRVETPQNQIKTDAVAQVPQEMKVEVFFSISSNKITEAESAKILALADYIKANAGKKVTLTGYADSATGNPSLNMKYALARAEAVKNALVGAGVSADRITAEAKGDKVQPFAENDKNRVCICIAK